MGLIVLLSGVCLALAGLGTFSNASRQSKQSTSRPGGKSSASHSFSHAQGARNVQYSPADNQGRFRYMIKFAENGMLQRQTRTNGQHFQANTPQAQALRAQVMKEQADHIQAMNRALGHDLNVSHYFLVTHSGIAARMTPEEAQAVRALPGIQSIERERVVSRNDLSQSAVHWRRSDLGWQRCASGQRLAPRAKASSLRCSIPASIQLIHPLPTIRIAVTARPNRHKLLERSRLFEHRRRRLVQRS